MKRRVLIALLVATVGVVGAAPAGAKKSTTCDLLTKKQVSKILGHKVVTTASEKNKTNGAGQCDYVTSYYQQKRFEDLDAPYKLKITTQPIAGIESDIDALEADPDSDAVAGLGERAFYNDGNDLLVVVGDLVLMAEVTNVQWSGNERDTLVRTPELEAMKLLVPLFDSVSGKK
ncbi:MAG: hypothetical protein WDA60_06300 [Acidimicrobiia bacterium]|jgi:hypothetical protein